ncbi:trans-1,2-dihydrobenzene-1,2-diol dehydrogenase-like [Venturia canescens]|uniref:trans-1,2-dihydrobenzene-1,2-diol dehydrogenase-like n=1 Tax=Venturia canescens TaxID=32260 RepID=UPI001C9C164E|nr:trans-1,2-dihydrobenzene-1,2-diol dehydrogenase-like [Venturia canescens]
MALRWGIASAGKISHDFTIALSTLPETEHCAVAVAARDLSRAKAFAELHAIKNAYDSYEQLAHDSNIDVVYVGCLNTQHLAIAKLMLQNGKNVVCEKPLTLNKKQTAELIGVAQEKGLFLMEAIWSRFFPAYDHIKKELAAGTIGIVKQVIVSFGFDLSNVERLSSKEQGGGTILDLGVYTIQFASFIFEGEKPRKIRAAGHLNGEGVDTSMSATLLYGNDRLATIVTNGTVNLQNEAVVIGTEGIIRVPNFWCPTSVILPSRTVEFPLPGGLSSKKFNFINSAGLRYEAEHVRYCIRSSRKESERMPHEESILIAEIEDELRRQIGVIYNED